MEIFSNHNEASDPYLITATGEPVTEPLSLGEQPVFGRFGEEFNSVRYAWDNIQRDGINEVNESAKEWPEPITLYYLDSATQAVLSVLQKAPWDPEITPVRRNRTVNLSLDLDQSTFHTDWPRIYIASDPA